jgi:kynureninase
MYENSRAFAAQLDEADSLKHFRDKFHIPVINGKQTIYFTGNSLGLEPKATRAYIETELKDWATLGVEGHFLGTHPWYSYHEMFEEPVSRLVGALPHEVAVMNTLTTNLHLMMVSFYRPKGNRYKILVESSAFPSDQYAVESQVRFHGYEPQDAIIELLPREGEVIFRMEDIKSTIEEYADEIALVLLGGVNYYTGQALPMAEITKAAHDAGALVGFDLAHAAGNILLNLHDWKVDFAVWCSYKYLNSGPGGVSGIFVHDKWCNNPTLPRFAGWWGYDKEKRFKMQKGFSPMQGAAGWQLSNAQILPMAAHKASLDIFMEAGFENLRNKSERLTGFLDFLIKDHRLNKENDQINIITPEDPAQRGAQLSIIAGRNGREKFDKLTKAGIIADWREPDVIRVAPVPLYNTYTEVFDFAEQLFSL